MKSRDVNILVLSSSTSTIESFLHTFETYIDSQFCTFQPSLYYYFHFTTCTSLEPLQSKLDNNFFHLVYMLMDQEEMFLAFESLQQVLQHQLMFLVFLNTDSLVKFKQQQPDDCFKTFVCSRVAGYKSLYNQTIQYCTNLIFPTLEQALLDKQNESTSVVVYEPTVDVDTSLVLNQSPLNETDTQRLVRIEQKLDLLIRMMLQRST